MTAPAVGRTFGNDPESLFVCALIAARLDEEILPLVEGRE